VTSDSDDSASLPQVQATDSTTISEDIEEVVSTVLFTVFVIFNWNLQIIQFYYLS